MLRVRRVFPRPGVALQRCLDLAARFGFLPREARFDREDFRRDGFANVTRRSRVLHLGADTSRDDEIERAGSLKLEQPVDALIVRRSIPVKRIGVNRNRRTRVPRSVAERADLKSHILRRQRYHGMGWPPWYPHCSASQIRSLGKVIEIVTVRVRLRT